MARRKKCRLVGEHNKWATAVRHVHKIESTGARAYYRKTNAKVLRYKVYSCRGSR